MSGRMYRVGGCCLKGCKGSNVGVQVIGITLYFHSYFLEIHYLTVFAPCVNK